MITTTITSTLTIHCQLNDDASHCNAKKREKNNTNLANENNNSNHNTNNNFCDITALCQPLQMRHEARGTDEHDRGTCA